MRLHMDEISKHREEKINELISACEKKDKTKIMEKVNSLIDSSRNFILTSFEFQYRRVEREGPFQLLLCVGIEMILNAVIIMESPGQYVELYKKRNEPPSFEAIKQCSKKIIAKSFNKKQNERMTDVMDLIQNKRNIFAHFSLGIHALYYQHYEILNVILFLFSKYFPFQTEAILKIGEMRERFRMKNISDYDFVDFN